MKGAASQQRKRLEVFYHDTINLLWRYFVGARSSMIISLYNNTKLINYLKHLGKSCIVPIIRIEDSPVEAKIVKFVDEYSENHLGLTLAYELFHSPRPPKLLFCKIGSWFLYLNGLLVQCGYSENMKNCLICTIRTEYADKGARFIKIIRELFENPMVRIFTCEVSYLPRLWED